MRQDFSCEAHRTLALASAPSAVDLSELHGQFFEAKGLRVNTEGGSTVKKRLPYVLPAE